MPSRLVRLKSVLVLRLSVLVRLAPLPLSRPLASLLLRLSSALCRPVYSAFGNAEDELARECSAGRWVSRLLRALPEPALRAPRGGGGGGGMVVLPAKSPEEERTRLLRLEADAEPGAGAASVAPSRVLRLLELDAAVRTELLRWGGGEGADGLEEPMSESRAPWRDGGGGGGDFRPLSSTSRAFSAEGERGFEGGASRDCWDDRVSEELRLERLSAPAEEWRSWLCLRARGTGGGFFFAAELERLSGEKMGEGSAFSSVSAEGGDVRMGGVGGSGLFVLVSDTFRGLVTGDARASFVLKLSNGTVCGCRGDTSLP